MNQVLHDLGIDRLDINSRLELIGLIWDSLDGNAESEATPEWHVRELELRREAADANPEAAIPWEAVKSRLTTKQ
jgi:putative addiction module component (TIGR02574 family)